MTEDQVPFDIDIEKSLPQIFHACERHENDMTFISALCSIQQISSGLMKIDQPLVENNMAFTHCDDCPLLHQCIATKLADVLNAEA